MLRHAVLLALYACATEPDTGDSDDTSGGIDTSDPDGDPMTVPLGGTCPLDTRWGAFKVEANTDYSAIDGAIADGVVPVTILEEALSEGDCRLMKRNNPFCDPSCGPGTTCDFDGTCIPYPANQDVGTVSITGLRDAVVMEPVEPSYKYFYTELHNPAFEAGKLIQMKSTGGAYAAVTLHGVGVAVLAPPSVDWLVTAGEALQLTWDAPTTEVRSEVFASVNVDQHGITPLTLECVFADDGAAEVPASVMDALLSAGVTGYPSGKLQRRTVDRADVGAGCVDFMVDYTLKAKVSVAGHTPCTGPGDCPEGMECNLAIQTCE